MARKKPDKRKASEPPARLELRADPAWIARLQRQAERLGLSVSAYIRQAVTPRIEQDEATDPELKDE